MQQFAIDTLLLTSKTLRARLDSLIQESLIPTSAILTDATVIVTPNEVNGMHGTGVLLGRMFKDTPNVVTIRTYSNYDSIQTIGDIQFCIPHPELKRAVAFQKISSALQGIQVSRILCVPYFPDDVLNAIAIKEITGAPLCTYVMDDNLIYTGGIPEPLMAEALTKSALRLAISTDMRVAYEKRFGLKFWTLPPTVSHSLIYTGEASNRSENSIFSHAILVGNIWSQSSLDLLRETAKTAGIEIHWYCNSNCQWLNFDQAELERDNIILFDPLPEPELAKVLQKSLFAVLPSGTLDETDGSPAVARLSLPTRVPFILATSNTPILVLGSPQTAASRFVERFQIGCTAAYDTQSFNRAIARLSDPETQATMRQNAAAIARDFSDQGVNEWIWTALDEGAPSDLKYEKLLAPTADDFAVYLEPQAPKEVFWSFRDDYSALKRLRDRGVNPDFVVDIGASTGIWSSTASKVFPKARFILVDPLLSKYDPIILKNNPQFETLEVAVADEPGRITFQVSGDLYGSSLLQPMDTPREYESIEVEVKTLDNIFEEKQVLGRGIIKIDVQCAEHLVLAGAKRCLEQIDIIIAELSLVRFDQNAKILTEMLQLLGELGFRYYDEMGIWRSPKDGTLLQKDILFVRESLQLTCIRQSQKLED